MTPWRLVGMDHYPQCDEAAPGSILDSMEEFREMRLEVSRDMVIVRLGDYTVQTTRDHSHDFCLCPSGTLGGRAEEPLLFQPGETIGGRRPCRHLRALWALAPILWTLGQRLQLAEDSSSLARRFVHEVQESQDKEYQRAIARAIETGIQEAMRASIQHYRDGGRTFSLNLISEVVVPDAIGQFWRSAISRELVRSGFWTRTDMTIATASARSHGSLIRAYSAGPMLIAAACDPKDSIQTPGESHHKREEASSSSDAPIDSRED